MPLCPHREHRWFTFADKEFRSWSALGLTRSQTWDLQHERGKSTCRGGWFMRSFCAKMYRMRNSVQCLKSVEGFCQEVHKLKHSQQLLLIRSTSTVLLDQLSRSHLYPFVGSMFPIIWYLLLYTHHSLHWGLFIVVVIQGWYLGAKKICRNKVIP